MIDKIVNEFKKFEEVEGMTLGGSHGAGTSDDKSDYDLYVYLNAPLDVEKRRNVLGKHCSYMEYDNHFWEPEDDGILQNGIDIELIYRSIDELDRNLEELLDLHKVSLSYTTCFWDNILVHKILYDPRGKLADLKKKYDRPYPVEVKDKIVTENCKLLADYMPSFYFQLEKAVARNDLFSINHRLTELLATYFNVIFALNETNLPGEKRLVEVSSKLEILPEDHTLLLSQLFETVFRDNRLFLETLNKLLFNLHNLLISLGYKVSWKSYPKAGDR